MKIEVKIPSYSFIFDKKLLKKTLMQAAREVAKIDRAQLKQAQGSGRLYGKHRASAPGDPATKITGTLAGSVVVSASKAGDTVFVREKQFYSLFLNAGAKGGGNRIKGAGRSKRSRFRATIVKTSRILAPRPSLEIALSKVQGSIAKRIQDAVVNGLTFKLGKPKIVKAPKASKMP